MDHFLIGECGRGWEHIKVPKNCHNYFFSFIMCMPIGCAYLTICLSFNIQSPNGPKKISSTSYGCLLAALSFLQSMNNENLIKFSKNMKIWKFHVTSSLAFWTMGIFHSLTKSKCFNRFMLKSCRTSIIWFSKLQNFTWLSSELVVVTSSHLGLYFWSNFN